MKNSIHLTVVTCLLATIVSIAQAAPPQQIPDGEAYTVQAGDWLTKIADKYYGDPLQYEDILAATNAKAAEDDSYITITDADYIEVGQILWVPRVVEEGGILAGDLAFSPTEFEQRGFNAIVPSVWTPLESNDPLLSNGWGSGPLSFVSFTTIPGNDGPAGLARLLGITRDDIINEVLGGEFEERQVGERTWSIYTRDDGKIASVVAATVEQKAIYRVSLFIVSPQRQTVLDTILENFTITDPALAQQAITIENIAPGQALNSPFDLRGASTQYPFLGTLIYRVLDAGGNQVGRGSFPVTGILGSPTTFAVAATYEVETAGPGTIEVAEVSVTDGTIIALDSIAVQLEADPPGYPITIDDPAPFSSITTPVQIRGKTEDKPFGGILSYRIVDAQGTEIASGALQATGQIGQVNLYDGFADFGITTNGPGRVEVYDINPADGSTFTIKSVNVWLTMP